MSWFSSSRGSYGETGWPRGHALALAGKVILVLVLLLEVMLVIILDQKSDRLTESLGEGSQTRDRNRTNGTFEPRHKNEKGGFAFRAPRDWNVRDQGLISEMVSPGQSVAMTVGRVPGIQELRAEQRLLSALREDYRGVTVTKRFLDRGVLDKSTRQVRGRAVNKTGLRVRFAAELSSVKGELYAFLIFQEATQAGPLMPPVRSVQKSFAVL